MVQWSGDSNVKILSPCHDYCTDEDDTHFSNNMAEEKKEKKFELNAKKVFLTYSDADVLSKDIIETKIKTWKPIKYIIGEERHESGAKHFHCCIFFAEKLHTTNQRFFDIGDEHPNIKTLKKKAWEEKVFYCMKEDPNPIQHRTDPLATNNPTNYRKRKADFLEWKHDIELRARQPVVWPIILPTGQMAYNSGKKRHWWIRSEPDQGKSHWIHSNFANREVYLRPNKDHKYPYECYEGEEVIFMDDVIPCFQEIVSISEVYSIRQQVYGNVRYVSKFWPLKQQRVMIVFNNLDPDYGPLQAAFEARFNVVTWQ